MSTTIRESAPRTLTSDLEEVLSQRSCNLVQFIRVKLNMLYYNAPICDHDSIAAELLTLRARYDVPEECLDQWMTIERRKFYQHTD